VSPDTLPTAAEPTAAVVLRPRPVPGAADVYCGDCWDPLAHDGTIWRHARTGLPATWHDRQCAPLCDWPDCTTEADAGRSLGADVFDGAALRWRASHFLCDDHWAAYRRAHFVTTHT